MYSQENPPTRDRRASRKLTEAATLGSWKHNPYTRHDQGLPRGLNPARCPIICRHFYGLEAQETERAA